MVIRVLGNSEEAVRCEPWLTLGRSFEEALRVLQDPLPGLSGGGRIPHSETVVIN